MSRTFTFTIDGFQPNWSVHPGRTLAEVLEEAGWTQAELARQTRLSQKHISRVITGKAAIGPQMALRLEDALHVSARFWARYQAEFDIFEARRRGEIGVEAPSEGSK